MDPGERAARERLETFFRSIDRLTPDELARIGFRLAPADDRRPLLRAVQEAARRTGRAALVAEARQAALDAVMGRYSAGSLHPTFVALNWGLTQGTVESRVAIAETLADAAAAAVVEDALDAEIAAAFALDAAAITNLATGEAFEGSFARVLRDPEDPELRAGPGARRARRAVAVGMVALPAIATGVGAIAAVAAAVVAGVRASSRSGGRRD